MCNVLGNKQFYSDKTCSVFSIHVQIDIWNKQHKTVICLQVECNKSKYQLTYTVLNVSVRTNNAEHCYFETEYYNIIRNNFCVKTEVSIGSQRLTTIILIKPVRMHVMYYYCYYYCITNFLVRNITNVFILMRCAKKACSDWI